MARCSVIDIFHSEAKMREMITLRKTKLKTMTREEYQKKETETFAAVRDFLKEHDSFACNRCYKMPWIIYGVYSFEKCVEILLIDD